MPKLAMNQEKKTYFLKWPTTASICLYLYDFGILQECLYFSASRAYSASMIPVDTGQFQENLPVMEQDLEAKKPKCRHHFGQSCSLPIKGVAIGSLHLQSLKLSFSSLNIGRNPKGKEASNHQFSGPMLVSGGFISQFSLVWQNWFDQYFSSLPPPKEKGPRNVSESLGSKMMHPFQSLGLLNIWSLGVIISSHTRIGHSKVVLFGGTSLNSRFLNRSF